MRTCHVFLCEYHLLRCHYRIGAQILSHHVDDFTLVTGFFVFVVGCINMLLGLIFRESAKSRRSIRNWRNEGKDVLPKNVEVSKSPFMNPMFTGSTSSDLEKGRLSEFGTNRSLKEEKVGYGFGRQGEKAAGLRGFILQRPEESLPRYATSPSSPRQSVRVSIPIPSSPPADLSRSKSTRTSTSSFASPASYRDTMPLPKNDQHSTRSVTPPPTFKSSPVAI